MGGLSIWHWLIVLAIVLLLFGNRLPRAMGDLAKGIKNFKSGLQDEPKASDTDSGTPAVPPPAGTDAAGNQNRTTADHR